MTQKANVSLQPNKADDGPVSEPPWVRPLVEKIVGEIATMPPAPTPFCDFSALVRHLPMYGERTLRELVKRKILPVCRPPGTRKLAFHLPSVEAALLRHQTNESFE